MAWYDVFSRFYDASLEQHYRVQRRLAVEALQLAPGGVVLDVPCGTGQSLPGLVDGVGDGGRVLGVDLSPGMLRESERRVRLAGWTGVHLLRADATTLTLDALADAAGGPVRPDRLLVFLGTTVFPDLHATFTNLWSLLAPGGRCVLVDCHAEAPGMQGRMVEWLAQADLRRRGWEELEAVCEGFERRDLPSKPLHGGQLWLATGTKPR